MTKTVYIHINRDLANSINKVYRLLSEVSKTNKIVYWTNNNKVRKIIKGSSIYENNTFLITQSNYAIIQKGYREDIEDIINTIRNNGGKIRYI